jgi:prefoldin subunit 4
MTNNKNQLDDDVHIKYEDQSKINKFAINNTKMHEYDQELIEKNKILQNLTDAMDELITFDDDEMIPFQFGEVFTHLTAKDANEELEILKAQTEADISQLEAKVSTCKSVLSELKTQLYAKFGNKINLEEAD